MQCQLRNKLGRGSGARASQAAGGRQARMAGLPRSKRDPAAHGLGGSTGHGPWNLFARGPRAYTSRVSLAGASTSAAGGMRLLRVALPWPAPFRSLPTSCLHVHLARHAGATTR